LDPFHSQKNSVLSETVPMVDGTITPAEFQDEVNTMLVWHNFGDGRQAVQQRQKFRFTYSNY
jgi:hypothetical protein